MSYIVLARRYRPQRFSEVVGQSHVVRTLANALKQGRLSHALLFSGIKGTGKTTVARIIAKALNCENLIDGYEPCNECKNCVEINKGIFVDVIEIDAASNRGIDQIREIIDNLKFAPAKGKAKVYIIDEAHMLTKEASNALLKSLEEPPSHVYFILATTEPNKLLPTILSRCQRYDFRRLDFALLIKHLKEVCKKENYEIEDEALKLIAREAQGSLRDALSLLDQAMAYGTKTKEDVISAFGWHEAILVEQLAQGLLERNLQKLLALSQEIYNQGVDLVYLMEKLVEFFRELFILKAFPKDAMHQIDSSGMRELVMEYELEEIFLILQSLLRDLEVLRRSSYPQLQFEIALVRICEYKKLVPLKDIVEKLDKISTENLQLREKTEEKSAEDLSEPQKKTWKDFVEILKKESPALYGVCSCVEEVRFENGRIILHAKESLLNSPYFQVFKGKIEEFFKTPVDFEIKKEKRTDFNEIKTRKEVQAIIKAFSAKIAYIQPINKE